MKKILCIVFALALAVSVTACAKRTEDHGGAHVIGVFDAAAADDTLKIDAQNEVHGISDLLYGIFFEDINFSADGGLYAEMVANRSFEFTALAKDDALYHWRTVGSAAAEAVTDGQTALNENNPTYLRLRSSGASAGIENGGWMEGMALKEGEPYRFSVYLRGVDGFRGGVTVRLNADGKTAAEGAISAVSDTWEKYELTLTSAVTAAENVTLQLLPEGGDVDIDMVSLFPTHTFKNRENGLRADLAGLLEAMHPKFLRFPGGCVIEGYDDATAYHWKDSVGVGRDGQPLLFNGTYGDVAARKQGINLWTDINATDDEWPSFMSYGLGFFEYFQLAEDIGALGVPVLNAGLYCQGRDGKGVPLGTAAFDAYVQDMLDLVEFCRGGEDTVWGKVRVSLGHAEPFRLKYICIGNENHSQVYYERYRAFLDALQRAKKDNPALYDGIELIYSSGGDDAFSGEAYLNSYRYARKQLGNSKNAADFAGAVDAHYYNDPIWFLRHTDYYDENNYRRSVAEMTDTRYGGAIPVFLGEYASWSNNLYSALSEAAYMTGLERNGDIVKMASYAPLFSSVTARHWAPNLIWFNNSGVQPSANYYIQRLFAENAGTALLKSTLDGADIGQQDLKGKAGVGTWMTAARFDNIRVTDNRTGATLYEEDFSSKAGFKKHFEVPSVGDFKVKGKALVQENAAHDYSEIGAVTFFGDRDWDNYTVTFDAVKTGGEEGFFIPVAVRNSDTAYFWNIGGWGNTLSALQEINGGKKTGQLEGTEKPLTVEEGRTYQVKITVDGTRIQCFLDGVQYIDYDTRSAEAAAYQVVSTDESGDIIIKLVNVTDTERTFAVTLENAQGLASAAKVMQVCGSHPQDENIFAQEECVTLREFEVQGVGESFNFTVPRYSATVLRIGR